MLLLDSMDVSSTNLLDDLNKDLFDIGETDEDFLMDVLQNTAVKPDPHNQNQSDWSSASSNSSADTGALFGGLVLEDIPSISTSTSINTASHFQQQPSLMVSSNLNDQTQISSSTEQQIVLKDKLLTDSLLNEEFPVINREHSYANSNGTQTRDDQQFSKQFRLHHEQKGQVQIKVETSSVTGCSDGDSRPATPSSNPDEVDMECYPCIPMVYTKSGLKRGSTQKPQRLKLKKSDSDSEDIDVEQDEELEDNFKKQRIIKNNNNNNIHNNGENNNNMHYVGPKHQHSLLKPRLINPSSPIATLSSPVSNISGQSAQILNGKLLYSRLSSNQSCVKIQPNPQTSLLQQASQQLNSAVPLTSSTLSQLKSNYMSVSHASDPHFLALQATLISNQPTDSVGELVLTNEEKKTLIAEGYPVPTKLPLSKNEEKSLKKIRRKIKNKLSAQESRRKKKEFVDTLERQVEVTANELEDYRRKCANLERENQTLLSQVKSLREFIINNSSNLGATNLNSKKSKRQSQNSSANVSTNNLNIKEEIVENESDFKIKTGSKYEKI